MKVLLALSVIILSVGAVFAGYDNEGTQLEPRAGLVPVSGFVYNESGEIVSGAVIILSVRRPDEEKIWTGVSTPEDGHYFFTAPEGMGHLSLYYGGYLIQRLRYSYKLELSKEIPRTFNFYLDDFIAARDPGDPNLSMTSGPIETTHEYT